MKKRSRLPSGWWLGGLLAALTLVGLPSRGRADGGNPSLVHACVNQRGQVTVVGSNDPCDPGERSLHWVMTGPQGPPQPTGQPGSPTCAPPTVSCGPLGCKNLATDVSNCGTCGRTCPSGWVCANGVCLSR